MTRLRLRLGLAALAFALPITAPVSVAQRVPTGGARLAPADHAPGGIHILTVLPNGSLGCDVATEAEAEALRTEDRTGGEVRLTPLPSLNRTGVSQFRIIIRATDQLLARPTALLAFRRAAARWERIIQSPVTTVIDLDYGPNRFNSGPFAPNVLASANSAQQFASGTASSGEMRDAIRARMTNPALIALVDAMPLPTPSTAGGEAGAVALGRAIGGLISLQSLGFRPASIDPDPAVNPFGTVPNIGFNSAFSYDFNPGDGISPGLTDFEAVTAHEIGHTLGFTSAIGQATAGSAVFTPWDMYRVRPEAVTPGESYTDGVGWEVAPRVITPGPVNTVPIEPGSPYFQAVQVIFDGEAEYETSTATGSRTGGDGQQASHWRDDDLRPPSLGAARKVGIMDPTIGAGEQINISPADIRTLELIGYVVNSTPSTAVAALTIGAQPVNIDFLSSVVRFGLPTSGGSIPIVLQNTGTGTRPLDFSFEVFVDSVQSVTPGATPSVSVTPADGSVAAGGQAALSLDVAAMPGGAVLMGRIHLRSTDPLRAFAEVPFQISVGTPGLAPTAAPATVDAEAGQTAPATVVIRNSGDAPLSYVRVLEPAASDPATARQPFEGVEVAAPVRGPIGDEPEPATEPGSAARQLAQLNIPGPTTTRLYDLAQLPTGEVVVVDGGVAASTRIFLAPADLSALTATYTSTASLGGQVTGIAYNERTASLWVAVQETGLVREIRLENDAIVLTGRQFDTGMAPFGMDYSPELDAFYVGTFSAPTLYAFDVEGTVLPGYPATMTINSSTPGISFTEGLLDVGSLSNRFIQTGQFGKTVTGTTTTNLPVTGYGLQRSRLDPNGTMYFTSRTSGSGQSVRTLDPPDVPAGVGTRIEAATPMFSAGLVAPDATRDLALVVDARGLDVGTVTDELAFLTNAPTARVVRFPVTINVLSVAGEDGPASAVDAVATWPNPARAGAQVQLTLGSAATVTVGVYNTLGQRVAVLAQSAPLAAGTHTLALRTEALAAGVYVVRVEAGGDVTTHKVTVVR